MLYLSLLSIFPIINGKSVSSIPSAGDGDVSTTTSVPNSCLNQQDNDNLIVKLLDGDSYPLINTKCRNQHMIIDLHQDELWKNYLTSTREYHYNLIGPDKDDHVNWQQWMIPEMESFLISPDCNSCDEEFELNRQYSTSSAYYMTPVAAGCTQLPIGRIGCDMDWHTYSCRVCETAQTREPGYWLSYEVYNGLNDPETTLHFEDEIKEYTFAKYGHCGFTIRDAKAVHEKETDTFEHCKSVTQEDVADEIILPRRKPSIGQDGRFCVCVKPNQYETFEVDMEYVMKKEQENGYEPVGEVISDEIDEDEGVRIVRLYQKDFKDGTYRITEPGKYVLMEDIMFDFKAPEGYKEGNLETYNGPNDWWPTYDQIEDYPGAGDLKNSYFLGFWAGITIECPDVILELNHHKLEMSEAFYYQQSFFALISLTSQVFLPGQGPGFFGAAPKHAENVMIRNGELGLSSHHGIQGNFNKNILIENMRIHDFKTHGIQFNGFDGITIKNVDVGPNRKIDELTPYYAHMKALLPTYRIMVDNEELVRDVCVHFKSNERESECVSMENLIEDVQLLLDMAFEYVVLDKNYDAFDVGEYMNDPSMSRKLRLWQENRNVLINDHHSTQTATLYGIFFNYIGANVIGWYAGSETTKSKNVVMDNVKIHDLHHDTFENIAFSQGVPTEFQRILNCLNAPFNAYHIFGEEQVNQISKCNNYIIETGDTEECQQWRERGLTYTGNKITDIQILSFELINKYDLSWNYCSAGANDMAALVDFAIRGTPFVELTPLLVGSHDPMIHPGKGVNALRLNGVDNVDIKDLKIEHIHSSTDVGSLLGGPYENVVTQQAPYMNGFSMNMVNGFTATFSKNVQLNNAEISHITSNTGLAYGVAMWYETHLNIFGKKGLKIHNIHAGRQLKPSDEFRRDSFPNLKPEGCAFRIYDDPIYQGKVEYDNNANNDGNVEISCVSGHTGCLMKNEEYSHIGYVEECDGEEEVSGGHGRKYHNKKSSDTLYTDSEISGYFERHHGGFYVVITIIVLLLMTMILIVKLATMRSVKLSHFTSERSPLLTE